MVHLGPLGRHHNRKLSQDCDLLDDVNEDNDECDDDVEVNIKILKMRTMTMIVTMTTTIRTKTAAINTMEKALA